MTASQLTNRERRVLGQLGIPRGLPELEAELRADPHSPSLDQAAAGEQVEEFVKRGWAVRVDGDRAPGKIAAALPKRARQMPDEQARIYEARLRAPRRAWRALGDLYVIADDGVEALKAPPEDEPRALTTSELQQLIVLQHQAVIYDFNPDPDAEDRGLAQSDVRWWNPVADVEMPLGHLTPPEWEEWLTGVVEGHRAVWGDGAVRELRLPVEGGAGKTDVYENRVLDQENQKTQMPALVAPWFMCLVILALTDTDTPTTARDGTHIPTYTGYAEKSVAAADMAAASGGSSANANPITFAACTGGSSTILGFGNKETNAATGDLRKYGTCASTTISTTQTPATFNAGAYTTTED